jgi:cysteine-rich repeat protein
MWPPLVACLATALILALATPAASQPEAAGARRAPVGRSLAERLARPLPAQGIGIRVTLRNDDLAAPGAARRAAVSARQDRVLGGLAAGEFTLERRYRTVAGFAGRAQPAAIEALRRHPEVVSVHLDGQVHAVLAQGANLVGATASHSLGLTGAGVNVAVLDTGVDTHHPDLVDDLVVEQCFCDTSYAASSGECCPDGSTQQSGPGSAEDDNGHGTHVAGVITSGGIHAAPGVAPDAGIVAVKVLSSAGNALQSSIDAGLDWVLTNQAAYGIRVVNLSLGDGNEFNNPNLPGCSTTPAAVAIKALHAAGVTVVAASGNEGHDDGISDPACIAEVISVGGVYDAAVGSVSWCGATCGQILCTDNPTAADVFVCHSNSDEILDLLAPDWRTRSSEMGGTASNFGGTSAASPYVAGQAALLLQSDATLQPEDIRTLLTSSGPLVTNPDNGLSFHRADVFAALASLAVCGDGAVGAGEDCDDGNTADGDCCDSACGFEPPGSACEDADACTTSDICNGIGSCVGGPPPDCDDANLCTDDACDPSSGCTHVDNTLACDDGDACTTADTCAAGACVGGPPPDCDDADPCTAESCDAITGCEHTPIGGCEQGATPAVPALPPAWLLALALALGAGGTLARARRR